MASSPSKMTMPVLCSRAARLASHCAFTQPINSTIVLLMGRHVFLSAGKSPSTQKSRPPHERSTHIRMHPHTSTYIHIHPRMYVDVCGSLAPEKSTSAPEKVPGSLHCFPLASSFSPRCQDRISLGPFVFSAAPISSNKCGLSS